MRSSPRRASASESFPSIAASSSAPERSSERARGGTGARWSRPCFFRRAAARRARAPGSGDERGSRDRGRLPRVPLGLGEGLVDLLERIFVRDEPVEREPGSVPHEKVERARDDAGVVLDHTHDLLRSPHEQRGLELDLGAAADCTDLQIGPTRAQHLDPFRDHLGEADEVARDVRAGAARPLADQVDALATVGDLLDVDRVVGAEGARQLEPPGQLVHDDHDGGAHVLGDRGRLDAEPAGALDDDGAPEGEPRAVEAEDHLTEGAVDRRHELVRQRVRDHEDRAARTQVVVLGERAVEVWELRRTERPLDFRRARRRLVGQARVAAPARIEVGVGDAIALFERAAQRVGLHAPPELRDAPGHLVAEDPAVLRQPERRVAAPEVEVRAADVGERDADQDCVGLDVGHGDLADLERLAGTEENRRLAGAHRLAPLATSKASCRLRTASSAYLSSITHDVAISDVEIIWMLMPSRASAANIVAATPAWLRIPTPTIDTLATRSLCTIPRAPISRATSVSSATARAWSPRGRVNDMSV